MNLGNNISISKSSINVDSNSGKIIKTNIIQKVSNDYFESFEKEKDSKNIEELENDKNKLNNLLTKDLINKMTDISPIPTKNLPQKKEIKEILLQEKEESFDEKDKNDFSSDEEEDIDDDSSDIEDFKPKDEINNVNNKSGKDINKKKVKFKIEEKKEDNGKEVKNNINYLNRTFSYNINENNLNKSDKNNKSQISEFFDSTFKHLKEEFEHDESFISDINKSHNFLPKLKRDLNINIENFQINNNNSNYNSISFENIQNDSLNFNINPNTFFDNYNQINQQNTGNTKEKNINNDVIINDIRKNNNNLMITNNINNDTNNARNLNIIKNENLTHNQNLQTTKEINNLNNQMFYNSRAYIPKINFNNTNKNYAINNQFLFNNNQNPQQKLLKNNFPNKNFNIFGNDNNFNCNFISNERQYQQDKIINNSNPNNIYNNIIKDPQYIYNFYQNISRFSQTNPNLDLNNTKINDNNNINLINQQNFCNNQNINSQFTDIKNIPKYLKNTNNNNVNNFPINYNLNNSDNPNNINIYNFNNNIFFNGNYLNASNPIKNISDQKKEETIKITNNNINHKNIDSFENDNEILNPDDYLIKMFGRTGWICRQCNNFNFETRNKCNRCQEIKMPKTKEEIYKNKENKKKNKKKNKERKTDWMCLNCKNLNYGFRKNCNRCNIERKDEYPTIFLLPNQKKKEDNNNMISINKFHKIKPTMNNDNINNNFENNNNINNNLNYNFNNKKINDIINMKENNLFEGKNSFINNYSNYNNKI